MEKKAVRVELENGVDARSVAEMVQLASKYKSSMYILVENSRVNAKSIMGMMTLNLEHGKEVTLEAEGEDEGNALSDMTGYLLGSSVSGDEEQ